MVSLAMPPRGLDFIGKCFSGSMADGSCKLEGLGKLGVGSTGVFGSGFSACYGLFPKSRKLDTHIEKLRSLPSSNMGPSQFELRFGGYPMA